MALKVTQAPVDVLLLESVTANARVSGSAVDVLLIESNTASARVSGGYIDVLLLEDGGGGVDPPTATEHPLSAEHVLSMSSFVLNQSNHVIKA